MTAPAGLTRLAPPPSLLSPAPSATLSPPLSEPDQQRPAEAGGRLSFFGRDGQVLLELSHGPAEAWERQKRWVAISKKPFWPPVTVAAPVGTIDARHAACQPSQQPPTSAGPASRKQPVPGRRQAGALFCRGREVASVAGRPSALCVRRLGRRPCRAARPAAAAATAAVMAPAAALSGGAPARRTSRLADTVRRLAERREQRAATSHSQRGVTRPATPRKRSQTAVAAAGRTPRGTPRPAPAPAVVNRQSTVHSIDSLLSGQSRAAAAAPPPPPPPPPPVVVPTPVRPPPYGTAGPYAAYAAYLAAAGGSGELCAVPPPPPPAGCAPLPLLLARLSGVAGGLPLPVQTRPSPAHASSGWYAAAIDYSQSTDEPLNLSKR